MLSGLLKMSSKVLRVTGQSLDKIGKSLEVSGYTETLNPSLRARKFKKSVPDIKGAYISNTSAVLGNVSIGAKSQIWYGAIVRGDISAISIGEEVTVGDRSVIRSSNVLKSSPVKIGNSVLIGSGVTVDSCNIEDNCFIGDGASVHEGAKMEKKSMLLPGSSLPEGSVVKTGEVWTGAPAKFLRHILPAELEAHQALITDNIMLASDHAQEAAKGWLQIETDAYDFEQENERSPIYYKRLDAEQLSYKLGEQGGHMYPGRIFDSPLNEEAHKRVG